MKLNKKQIKSNKMKKEFKIALISVLMIVLSNNIIAQEWQVKSYLRIENKNTHLTMWAKNTKELGSGYSLNTFVLVSDAFGVAKPWSEAVVGIGKEYNDWYFESLIGFQQSEDGIDLMFKPSWGYSKKRLSIFNSWELGFPSGSWWWTAHVDYQIYKKHYIGIMSRRYHGTGLEAGIVIKNFEIHLAQLYDTEVSEFKSMVGFKIKF